jgi:diguanylate cyclase (GGDEF)-like protein
MSTETAGEQQVINRKRFSTAFKPVVIGFGVLGFGYALINLPTSALGWGYLSMLLFGSFISPRMTLRLPRSRFAISFSDSLIFLAFLLYGGEGAIIIAAVEMFSGCVHLRRSGFRLGNLMTAWNVAVNIIATSATYLVLVLVVAAVGDDFQPTRSQHLITLLGILALSQFLVSSLFASALRSLGDGANLWRTWIKDCFSSSMSHIVGAGLAGIVFKIVNYGDVVSTMTALIAIGVAFLTYRQSIGEINTAFGQVEDAERAKAEAERVRRREAEQHASQLQVSLKKEEQANIALRKSERDFQHAALHDSLTGLANRKKFGDILRSLIETSKTDSSTTFQVLFLDIRSFKNINDSLGHTIGDKVLVIAAKRFVRMLNASDVVARIGGDEFAIILRDLSSVEKAQKVARRIYKSLTQPFSLSGHKISIDLNIGIAPSDPEYDTPEEILRDADIAMHFAKEKNDGPAVFNKELRDRFLERIQLEMDLRHAVERDELAMHYQPIVSLDDGRLVGFEALIRWHHPRMGMIPPFRFIPIAEDSGLILPITVWLLHVTCRQLAEWQNIGPEYLDLIVSVNISGKHLAKDELIGDVVGALQESQVAARTLKLEITESVAMENAEHTIMLLNKLKEIGVQLSIDDFGTGYSSLSYLHRLPFDTLKIDRSFVSRVGERGENSEVLQTVISLAKNLKMRVIAEGIETESQLAVLQNLGCDYGQGYLLAKPKSRDETEELLYKRPNWLPTESVSDPAEHAHEQPADREGLTVH